MQYALGRTEIDVILPPHSFNETVPLSLYGADTSEWGSTAVHLEAAVQDGFDGLFVGAAVCAADGCFTGFVNVTDDAIAVPKGTRVVSACRIRCEGDQERQEREGAAAAACAAAAAIRVGAKQPGDSGNGAKTQDLPWAQRLDAMNFSEEMGPAKEAQMKRMLSKYPDVMSFLLNKNKLPEASIDTTGFSPSFAHAATDLRSISRT